MSRNAHAVHQCAKIHPQSKSLSQSSDQEDMLLPSPNEENWMIDCDIEVNFAGQWAGQWNMESPHNPFCVKS